MREWLVAILLAALLPLALQAQDFWAKKDYREWSAKECAKLLTDSPWAKSRITTLYVPQPLGTPSSVPDANATPQITYIAQLWSAVPVRQAAVRQARLSPGFGKLSASERQAVEARQASLLAEKFPDRIVVRVEYSSTVGLYQQDLVLFWQTRQADLWKQDTYLYTSSGKYNPVNVRVAGGAGGSFELIFAREENGQPVVRPGDKSFTVEIQAPAIGKLPGERTRFEFKLKDMVLDGQPVF